MTEVSIYLSDLTPEAQDRYLAAVGAFAGDISGDMPVAVIVVEDKVTEVIFRKEAGGGILALFPCIPGTRDPRTCECYDMNNGYSYASVDYTAATKPASSEEYADTLADLKRRGYTVRIAHRFTQRMCDERCRELKI